MATTQELDRTFRFMAEQIWKFGESKFKGQLCTDPDMEIFKPITEELINLDLEPITHYDRFWEKKGKIVRLQLYTSDAFGAVMSEDLKFVKTMFIDVEGS